MITQIGTESSSMASSICINTTSCYVSGVQNITHLVSKDTSDDCCDEQEQRVCHYLVSLIGFRCLPPGLY